MDAVQQGADFDLHAMEDALLDVDMGADEQSIESIASTDSEGVWDRRVPALPLLPINTDMRDPSPRSPHELLAAAHAMAAGGARAPNAPMAPRASHAPRASVWASPTEAGGDTAALLR